MFTRSLAVLLAGPGSAPPRLVSDPKTVGFHGGYARCFAIPRPRGVLIQSLLGVLLLARSASGEDPVAVLITGPLLARIGEEVSFEVEIVNRSGRPLEKLRIIDYFDRGLRHAASASPIEQKGAVDMAAGTSRRISLSFTASEPGRQCHRVEILDTRHVFVGGATACVEVAAPAVAGQPAAAAPQAMTPQAGSGLTPPPVTVPLASTAPLAAAAAPAAAGSLFTAPAAPGRPGLLPTAPQPSGSSPVRPPVAATVPSVMVPPAQPQVTSVPTPSLELGLGGPAEVDEGAVASFTARVVNTGSVASQAGRLEFAWDDAFSPREASDGYTLGTGSVSWDLPAVPPGGELKRQLNLLAVRLPSSTGRVGGRLGGDSSRACVRGTLSGAGGGVIVADESCVLVRSKRPRSRSPQEAGLRITLADCDDPIRLGGATMLVCTVSNTGDLPVGDLGVVLSLPPQARLVGSPSPSRTSVEGSLVSFEAIPQLPAGGKTTFELAYRTPEAGTWKATARVTAADIDGSMEAFCTTTVLEP